MGKTGSLGVCCSMAQSFSQLILSRLLLSSQRVMLHTAVTSKSSYVEPGMPNLGLEMGPSTLKWPRVLGRTGLAWRAKGPGPCRLGS